MKKRICMVALFAGFLCFGQMRMIPHLTRSTGGFTTEIIIANTLNQASSYRFTPYLEDGTTLIPAIGSLAAGETIVTSPTFLFGTNLISHFVIEGDGISVALAYQDENGAFSAAHVRETNEMSKRWRIFPALFNDAADGIAVVNVGAQQAAISILQIRLNGTIAQEVSPFGANLGVQSKGLYLFDDDFARVADHYFEIRSDMPVALTALRFATGSDRYFWQTGAIPMPELTETADLVGAVAVLQPKAHGVSGQVTIIDEQTLRISQFNYDGLGPLVFVYVAKDNDFINGEAIGQELASMPYENATFDVSLPSHISLMDFNSVSIWCVQFSADFGSGQFVQP